MKTISQKTIKKIIQLLPNEGIKELNEIIDDDELNDSKITRLFAKYNVKPEDIKLKIGEKND